MLISAVIDTSVMVSVAFAKEGVAKKLRDLIAEDAFVMATSREILTELREVLHYPRIIRQFKASEAYIDAFIGLIVEHAVITEGRYSIGGITEDPKDDMFIACAMEAHADYIVSRDPHLRNIKHFQGIQIIDASAFIDKIKAA